MDVAASDVPVNLESVVTTSVVEENKKDKDKNEEESVAPPLKKPRFDEDAKRVAEILIVLSELLRIRGGKNPTELEIELMVEAKSKLVDMCQEFTPKDIFSRDAIGALIEDLGLNSKLKDQRLGFRAPKLTISEKLALGKRKIEESKKNPILSFTSQGHSTSAKNVYVAHQWPNNQKSSMKAPTSSVNAAAGSHFIRDASGLTQSRIERPQTGASQGPAVPDFGNVTSSSSQPQSSSSTRSFGITADSKVSVPSSSRVTDPSIRPFMSQTPPGTFPCIKRVGYGQTSSPFGNNHHAKIATLIHKVMQPRAKQNLLWNPPSREFMSKAITCQICQGTVNEVKTVLICDACEKGYHLKCLQSHNKKVVLKSEWHCSRCVQLYNGKSFRPQYGCVVRRATTAKMSSSTEKKVGKMDQKVNQEAMPHPETAKPTEDSAMEQTVEAEDAATNPIVEAEEAAKNPLVDAAMSQIVEAEEAAKNPLVEASMSQIVEAEDAAKNSLVEAAVSQIAEAEDATINQAVDANYESQDPIVNDDAERDDPSKPVSHSDTLNPPEVEKKVLSKDATEISDYPNCEDKNSKIIAESSLQEENSASQTENSPTQPPSSQSNTDHSQQQNATPNVQEAVLKNVTENPQEDKSC